MSVRTDREDGVYTIRLERAQAHNSIDEATLSDLLEALDAGMGSSKVNALMLESAGGPFCTGADLRVFQDASRHGRVEHVVGRVASAMNDVIETITLGPKPVIGCIDGVAAGGGLGLALACDLRYASPEARFVPAFAELGLAPDAGTSWFLPRMLGKARAVDVLMGNRALDADTADAWGLVTRLVDASEVREAAFEKATWLASQPGDAVAWTKRHLSDPDAFRAHLSREREGIMETARADAFQERLAAFFDKDPD